MNILQRHAYGLSLILLLYCAGDASGQYVGGKLGKGLGARRKHSDSQDTSLRRAQAVHSDRDIGLDKARDSLLRLVVAGDLQEGRRERTDSAGDRPVQEETLPVPRSGDRREICLSQGAAGVRGEIEPQSRHDETAHRATERKFRIELIPDGAAKEVKYVGRRLEFGI